MLCSYNQQRCITFSSFDSDEFKPRIIQVTNFQEYKEDQGKDESLILQNIKMEPHSEQESDEEQYNLTCEKSLFTIKPKREYPWKDEKEEEFPPSTSSNDQTEEKK